MACFCLTKLIDIVTLLYIALQSDDWEMDSYRVMSHDLG
jgi:hypothetical protein